MTTGTTSGRRGAPLTFLVAVVGGWAAARVATFTPLWEDTPPAVIVANSPEHKVVEVAQFAPEVRLALPDAGSSGAVVADVRYRLADRSPLAHPEAPYLAVERQANIHPNAPATQAGELVSAVLVSAAPYLAGVAVPAAPAGEPTRPARRWSADSWLLLRDDSTPALLAAKPSYGRSQAGAVLRYGLAPASAHLPQVHVRASSALAGPDEQEAAVGLSARLGREVPVRVAGELRVSDAGGQSELRPAIYAVTELPPFSLPLGFAGEVYLQGGYVGGSFATAFVDGQTRLERQVARTGAGGLSLGVGAWGGAQHGAGRLDLGPTAALSFRLGAARGRIAADYRFRVAGDAAPASGPALTVSAGF